MNAAAHLAGGLGLFLLGMGMMTDGLKLAAGAALQRILSAATRTRWHALGSGLLVTALVQSSGAVTVATIGFVNAGLLGLAPALWVLFGANVGTTTIGWIVALVGLRLQIEVLALPLIGVGILLSLGGEHGRRAALGKALAGFGLLFLGIATLQQGFGGLSDRFTLPQGDGVGIVLTQVGIGVLMTILTQSSGASMTITLTAAQGGLIGIQGAAAVVIGANIGTTVTALLASIGATSNARRVAAAHVAFNVITGLVAIVLLPWLGDAFAAAGAVFGNSPEPSAQLALFHTSFNVLGVLLMWPLAAPLTRWLQRRFRARDEDEANPHHLDDNVLAVPALALDALEREVARIGQVAVRTVRAVLAGARPQALAAGQAVLTRLDHAVAQFVERMNRAAMSQHASERLAGLLRVERYHESSAEQALIAAPLPEFAALDPALQASRGDFVARTDAVLALCEAIALQLETSTAAAGSADAAAAPAAIDLQVMELTYEALKAALLAAGAAGRLPLAEMEEALRRFSAIRRATQQAAKAAQRQMHRSDT